MGGSGLWPHLRANASASNADGRCAIDTEGKRVGIEVNGLIFRVLRTRLKDKSKAKGVVDHIMVHAALPDPELIIEVARDVVKEIELTAACAGEVYVVSEGNFGLKVPEADRRKAHAQSRVDAKDYRAALAIPDCLIRLIRAGIQHEARATALDMTTWMDLEYTEGEFQLLYMLDAGDIDVVLLYSGDADAAVIGAERGQVVLNPDTEGLAGTRKKKGSKGTRVTGKPVVVGGPGSVWTNVLLNPKAKGEKAGESADLSGWDAVVRAVVAAAVGHDYDTKSTGATAPAPAGLSGVAAPTAIAKLRAFTESGADAADGSKPILDRISALVRAIRPGVAEDELSRMHLVTLGFLMHPVVDINLTGRGGWKLKVPERYKWHSGDVESACDVFRAAGCTKLADAVHSCATARRGVAARLSFTERRPCKAGTCGIANFENALAEAASGDVDEVVMSIGVDLKPMTALAQPKLGSLLITDAFKRFSVADPSKHYDEGLERAYDSAAIADTQIALASDTTPPQCLVKETEAQSQGRPPYETAALFELTPDLLSVAKITQLSCGCHRRTQGVMCKHRAALLCRMLVNTVRGLAGNPVEREAYWKRRATVTDKTEATRMTHIATNRTGNMSVPELFSAEAKMGLLALNENADSDADDNGDDADDGAAAATEQDSKRRRKVDKSRGAARNEAVNDAFAASFNHEWASLDAIGEKFGIPGFRYLASRRQRAGMDRDGS